MQNEYAECGHYAPVSQAIDPMHAALSELKATRAALLPVFLQAVNHKWEPAQGEADDEKGYKDYPPRCADLFVHFGNRAVPALRTVNRWHAL